jgi:hypothetical protein
MKSTDDGHQISLVYPKKSNEVSITFRKHELNQHKFDFSGIFKKFTKIFSKKFNFFLQSTTTTESPDTIDEVVEVSEGSNESSTEDFDFSSSTTEDYEFSSSTSEDREKTSTGYAYKTPETTEKTGYHYTTQQSVSYETVPLIYLPPSRSPLSTYLLNKESPIKVYLPTN